MDGVICSRPRAGRKMEEEGGKKKKEWESTNKEAGEAARLKLVQGAEGSYLLATSLKNIS